MLMLVVCKRNFQKAVVIRWVCVLLAFNSFSIKTSSADRVVNRVVNLKANALNYLINKIFSIKITEDVSGKLRAQFDVGVNNSYVEISKKF